MLAFVNGRFLPEQEAVVSIFDRGFLYGDGLFETVRVIHGRPFRWPQHLQRLEKGADYLKLRLPGTRTELRHWADQLITQNQMPDSVLRLTVTRGPGARGYSPKVAGQPTLAMSLHPPVRRPDGNPCCRVITSTLRVAVNEPLLNFKTCNKLPQILARAEADAQGADDALLLNTRDEIAEAAGSNLFWIQDGIVFTPPLAAGILAGVTRELVLELCRQEGLEAKQAVITPLALSQTAGAFLSSSAAGLVEVIELDGRQLPRSPLAAQLQCAYEQMLKQECGPPVPGSSA